MNKHPEPLFQKRTFSPPGRINFANIFITPPNTFQFDLGVAGKEILTLSALYRSCQFLPLSDRTINGECKSNNIVYEATVTAEDGTMRNYIGMTEHCFKTQYADPKQSFEKKKYATKTSLSRYLWKLKESGIKYSIKGSVMQRARAYRSGLRQCNLCLAEKLCILNADKRFLLNKKSELISSCRHKNKFLC